MDKFIIQSTRSHMYYCADEDGWDWRSDRDNAFEFDSLHDAELCCLRRGIHLDYARKA